MYPTASAPQYAFGPGLAPVPMPGMAGGGLAALANQYRKGGRIRYFEDGGDAGDSATGGADSSTEGGAGAAMGGNDSPGPGGGGGGGGGSDPGAAAQAAAQAVDNAVAAAQDAEQEAAAEATLGAQVAAEAEEAEQTAAADQAAASLAAQAEAIAADMAAQREAIAQQEEDAKNAAMAAAMNNPQTTPTTPGFGISFQNPFTTDPSRAFGIFNSFANVTTPMGVIGVTPMDVAAPAMGRTASAVNSAVNAGRALGFAEGGVASLANQVQSKGRGQDTMLVHMTPGEVKGLQALAMSQGGSLTINPQTGLPEAGFLQRLLPAILGAGLTIASGGALTPLMAAGIVGGGYGVAKGSLKEGLMAGLGAYGGAGLGAGLTAAGGTTVAGQTATEAARQAAGQTIAEEAAKNAALEGITLPADYTQLAASTATPAQIAAQQGVSGNFAMAGRGLEGLMSEQGRTAFMGPQGLGSAPYSGTASVMAGAKALTPEPAPLEKSKTFIRPFGLDITNPSGTPQYTPGDTREREQVRYAFSPRPIYEAAQGGMMDLARGGSFDDEYGRDEYEEGGSVKKRKSRSLRGDPYYKFADSRRDQSMEAAIEQNFAKGGLGAALPPRFLSGGGDGMSDSIKANIDGKQEARLADGEFVVPADVVSHLGNGSSKAGAKKLYAMMDKIRKARTGRERQAPEVNAQRYMPA